METKQMWMDQEANEGQITVGAGLALCLAWDDLLILGLDPPIIGGYWVQAELTHGMTSDEYVAAHGGGNLADDGWLVDDDRGLAVHWYRADGDPNGTGNAGDFWPSDALLDAFVSVLV